MAETFQREITNASSNSNVVVKADAGGLTVTLNPLDAPVTGVDVYEDELDRFREAVEDAIEFVEEHEIDA